MAQPQVWFFLQEDCPISRYYGPEMQRICREHSEVRCVAVFVNRALSDGDAVRKAIAMGLQRVEVRVDRDRALVRHAEVRTTPEAAVFSPGGRLVYRGRIDNYFFGWGQRRGVVTAHDLRDALALVSHGGTYPQPWPKAIGCSIDNLGDRP